MVNIPPYIQQGILWYAAAADPAIFGGPPRRPTTQLKQLPARDAAILKHTPSIIPGRLGVSAVEPMPLSAT